MLVHELGHLYFGFGLTSLYNNNDDWFAYGLGCVYDRLAWSKMYRLDSPLFSSVNKQWKDLYAHNKNIDQKLIDPNTQNDKAEGLERKQIYGHGKSFYFLTALRKSVGTDLFDLHINKYLQSNIGKPLRYEKFINTFSENVKERILNVENEYEVR